jgi:hypothetical protein
MDVLMYSLFECILHYTIKKSKFRVALKNMHRLLNLNKSIDTHQLRRKHNNKKSTSFNSSPSLVIANKPREAY